MIQKLRVKGRLFSGIGKGQDFMAIGWVKEGIRAFFGFEPFPGTLNLKVSEEDFRFLISVKEAGKVLRSPLPQFCNASLLEARIGDIPCAVIFPEELVWVHENTLEIVSSVKLRDFFGLEDQDEVEVEIVREFTPKLVIFDLDGTLIDSVGFFFKMAKRLLGPYGILPSQEGLRDAMNRGLDPWPLLVPEGVFQRERLLKELREKDAKWFSSHYERECEIFPGVKECLKGLRSMGIRASIVTSTWDICAVEAIFLRHGIDIKESFDSFLIANKSTPRLEALKEAIEETLSRLGIERYEAVYVGDAEINILAGRKIRVFSLGVLTGVGTEEGLTNAGADKIIPSLSELLDLIKNP